MGAPINIREVARKAGVSAGTVSRILNATPGYRVAAATREKVLAAARELDYTPNVNAQRLFRNRAGIVALVVPPPVKSETSVFEDRHLCRILGGIEETLSAAGARLMLVFTRPDFIRNREYLKLFRSRQLDGLLIWGAALNDDFWREAIEKHYPHLFLSSKPDLPGADANFIHPDYEQAGRDALRELLAAGHRRIAFVNGVSGNSVCSDLSRGIDSALAGFGLERRATLVEFGGTNDLATGYRAAVEVLESYPEITAFAALNHDISLGIEEALSERGFRIPADFSLICCDSCSTEMSIPSITRGCIDDWGIGGRAAAALLEIVEKPETHFRETVPFRRIAGETVGAPRDNSR